MGARRGWRRRLGGLVLEAVMVVFAVLVALWVDEWNEGREIQEQVDRARTAVEAEIRSNQAELRAGRTSVATMRNDLARQVTMLREGETLTDGGLDGELPDFTDAAWETARATGTIGRMDYDWVLRAARVYETQRLAVDLQNELLGMIGGAFARRPEVGRFEDVVGQLSILLQIYENLADKYDAALPRDGGGAGGRP